jgi:hypothetical protein
MCKKQRENVEIIDKHINIVMLVSESFVLFIQNLRSKYYFVGDRSVHKLPFGPKCHELFVILYKILANLSDDMFFVIVYAKNEFEQNPEENIILTGPGQYIAICLC